MADAYRELESGNGNGVKAAMAKAVELRALHAALMQSPIPSASPISRHASHLSAQDYPVFTPSYDDDPLPGYQQILLDNRSYTESWGDGVGNVEDDSFVSDYTSANESSRKGVVNFEGHMHMHICPSAAADHHHFSTTNLLRSSPHQFSKSRRNSMGDMASISSSCNRCKPAVISSESEQGVTRRGGKSNIVVPLTDSHSSLHPQPRSRGLGLPSWLFPRLKKKSKNEGDGVGIGIGIVSVETLRKEVAEANESRDAAQYQAAEMRSSLGELKSKLEYLESYCEELKKALRQAVHSEKLSTNKRSGKSMYEKGMAVSEEVMVEGFLQMVSEARLSVRQFCKTLLWQISETDHALVDNLNSLLQPYKLSLASKYSKAVVYHLEAIINQSLFQDFENCVFQRNGAPKHLDPQQQRQTQFQSLVALRDLDWNEVLRKGTKYYSEELSRFCDQKMSGIIATVGCTRPWAEQLLQAFFVAAKCIWLVHSMAFSFEQPLGILRVEENMAFDAAYMEDIFADKQRSSQGGSRVKIMVMPGFYVLNRVLRCKVLCRYKSLS
ncbi:IRK-interacting protein-like [Salvia miltiorrhiza]|uniref:IRK-interacting protein-like n=1 Tax=Salvia miltiorrhiza TaxID=226208 RepID=UPI0025AC145C|nr:IRK-interacting protein-like [Salvia miltiorrhiza]